MSKFVKTKFNSGKEILKLAEYVAIPVTVSDAGVTADENGKKIVPAGTIIAGVGGSRLANPSLMVAASNTASAEGVLLDDVDVTYGAKDGSMVIYGYIDLTKLPAAPTAEAVTALNMIKFLG